MGNEEGRMPGFTPVFTRSLSFGYHTCRIFEQAGKLMIGRSGFGSQRRFWRWRRFPMGIEINRADWRPLR
jgi:hypothetical protein